ncbi:hypothetical protein KS4_23460 [Poriferisphaera corsica]|uniref:Uncharacterized protein n=1 Tax=Poriferisphaera corsica TaxID=2528020 RepID=A0A517YVP2_9BACT|nr:hypothetical protein [Poriferisphaera corsica]QDU34279.1 hypothetical protein KS4_23460 [Poriferisphaera corsica]
MATLKRHIHATTRAYYGVQDLRRSRFDVGGLVTGLSLSGNEGVSQAAADWLLETGANDVFDRIQSDIHDVPINAVHIKPFTSSKAIVKLIYAYGRGSNMPYDPFLACPRLSIGKRSFKHFEDKKEESEDPTNPGGDPVIKVIGSFKVKRYTISRLPVITILNEPTKPDLPINSFNSDKVYFNNLPCEPYTLEYVDHEVLDPIPHINGTMQFPHVYLFHYCEAGWGTKKTTIELDGTTETEDIPPEDSSEFAGKFITHLGSGPPTSKTNNTGSGSTIGKDALPSP